MNEDDAPPNLIDLLNQLAEPAPPAPIPMVPETAGWWVLAAILVTAGAFMAWRAAVRWHANAYRRAALAELARTEDDPAAIAAILRRAALAAHPRADVASLVGHRWAEFLRATGGFPDDLEWDIARAPYQPNSTPSPALRRAAEDWVRRHKRVRPAARS